MASLKTIMASLKTIMACLSSNKLLFFHYNNMVTGYWSRLVRLDTKQEVGSRVFQLLQVCGVC